MLLSVTTHYHMISVPHSLPVSSTPHNLHIHSLHTRQNSPSSVNYLSISNINGYPFLVIHPALILRLSNPLIFTHLTYHFLLNKQFPPQMFIMNRFYPGSPQSIKHFFLSHLLFFSIFFYHHFLSHIFSPVYLWANMINYHMVDSVRPEIHRLFLSLSFFLWCVCGANMINYHRVDSFRSQPHQTLILLGPLDRGEV